MQSVDTILLRFRVCAIHLTIALALAAALVDAPLAAWGADKSRSGRQVSESGLVYELRRPGAKNARPGLIIRRAGVKDVVFKEYLARGHGIFDEEIKPFFEWLAKQKRTLAPGVGVKWDSDLDAALQSGKKVLAYFYPEKDKDSDMAQLIEFELLTDKDVQEAAAQFACVKIDRDKSDLKITRPMLAVLDSKKK